MTSLCIVCQNNIIELKYNKINFKSLNWYILNLKSNVTFQN